MTKANSKECHSILSGVPRLFVAAAVFGLLTSLLHRQRCKICSLYNTCYKVEIIHPTSTQIFVCSTTFVYPSNFPRGSFSFVTSSFQFWTIDVILRYLCKQGETTHRDCLSDIFCSSVCLSDCPHTQVF